MKKELIEEKRINWKYFTVIACEDPQNFVTFG